MKQLKCGLTSLLLLCGLIGQVNAAIVTTADPSVTTDIGARIRWGGTGFEASVFDNSPFSQTPTLNPSGTPVWLLNVAYKFQVAFDSVTGALSLSVDFDRNNTFGAGESISQNLFAAPGLTSYVGQGFNYLSISGNEGGSTARSTLSNLVINGTSLSGIAPTGTFSETFYKDSASTPLTSIVITGDLTYLTSGTSQERPSWNFNFKGPADASATVPEPASLIVWSLVSGIFGLGGLRKRLNGIASA